MTKEEMQKEIEEVDNYQRGKYQLESARCHENCGCGKKQEQWNPKVVDK